MRHESLLDIYFAFGLFWRGKTLGSWLVVLISSATLDAVASVIFTSSVMESVSRALCTLVGLVTGLLLVSFVSLATGKASPPSPVPCLMVACALLIGQAFLPDGVESGMLTLGMAGSLVAVSLMIRGSWAPDLIFPCCGLLVGAPVLNMILLDTGDTAGWDGSRGFNWLTPSQTEIPCLTPDAPQTDLVGLAETAIVASVVIVGGLLSLPVLFLRWVTPEDLDHRHPSRGKDEPEVQAPKSTVRHIRHLGPPVMVAAPGTLQRANPPTGDGQDVPAVSGLRNGVWGSGPKHIGDRPLAKPRVVEPDAKKVIAGPDPKAPVLPKKF
jgi:hypothetical protein